MTNKVTGAGRVVEALIAELGKYSEHEFVVFHTKAVTPCACAENVRWILLDVPLGTIKNLLIAGFYIRRHNIDVLYYTFVDIPLFLGLPVVAVVYDLFYMWDREYFASGSICRYWLVKMITWWRLFSAHSLIAISETTRAQIRALPLLSGKTIHKVDLCLHTPPPISSPTKASESDSSQGYLLYVGNNRNHKNLRRLVEAFSIAKKRGLSGCTLVMCGAIDPRYDNPLASAKEYGVPDSVIHLGHVRDDELDALYANCMFVVVPSLYEGFGLPALEAASRGKAVLSSSASALREVLGDAGIYCDPYDIEAWAAALTRLVSDEPYRTVTAKACYERSKMFSRERFGRETIDALLSAGREH